tara:strand:- start:830 stop:1081 length:252 start_codon:yes stop_codon:yes gene_type:complete
MRLKRIQSNLTQVDFDNGSSVMFSYQTPVAGITKEGTRVKTSTYYSRTTNKHISQWLSSTPSFSGYSKVISVLQEEINNLPLE